jgi:hypothetical protein
MNRETKHSTPQDLNYGTSCSPCPDVVYLRRSIIMMPNLVFDCFSIFLAAQKYPGSVTTSQRSRITAALLQRRTLIGYLDLSFTVADLQTLNATSVHVRTCA